MPLSRHLKGSEQIVCVISRLKCFSQKKIFLPLYTVMCHLVTGILYVLRNASLGDLVIVRTLAVRCTHGPWATSLHSMSLY